MNLNSILLNLLLRKPYYGYIATQLKIEENAAIDDLKVLVGPTIRLLYNKNWLESLSESQAYGVIIHEILHLIFLHCTLYEGKKESLWNLACDLAVNEHIDQSMLPDDYITVQRINSKLCFQLEDKKTAEYYYTRLLQYESRLDFSLKQGKSILKLPGEDEFTITSLEKPETSDINLNAAKTSIEEITREAAKEGEIPGAIRTYIEEVYGHVEVDWRNVLKKYISGKGYMRQKKTMKRLSKRFDDTPGNIRTKGLNALIAVDESGSISDDDILTFYTELKLIKRLTKCQLMITRFDTTCSKPVPLDKYLKIRNRVKSGGTDFKDVFRVADSFNCMLVILFTDGDGLMPETVQQKVLWVLTSDKRRVMPFGDVVYFTGA